MMNKYIFLIQDMYKTSTSSVTTSVVYLERSRLIRCGRHVVYTPITQTPIKYTFFTKSLKCIIEDLPGLPK